MATEVIKIIDPDNGSGTDYTSLSAWEAAQQGDLTGVRDEIAVAKCRCTGGTADTAAVTINGWTTSSTQYIKIWTDPAESYRHAGSYPTGNKYRLYVNGGATGSVIRVEESDVKVIGIAVRNHTYAANGVSFSYSLTGILIEKCVASGDGVTAMSNGIVSVCPGQVVVNNFVETATTGIYCAYTDANYVYNNTVRNCTTGILGHWSNSCRAKNNLVDSTTTAYSNGFHADSTNNAGDDDTAPGSNAIYNITVSFTGANNCILAATGNDEVIGDAANLYNDAAYAFQSDILGTDRGGSGASWDIGAYEYVAAAGTRVPFRRLNILLRLCLSMFNLIWRCFK